MSVNSAFRDTSTKPGIIFETAMVKYLMAYCKSENIECVDTLDTIEDYNLGTDFKVMKSLLSPPYLPDIMRIDFALDFFEKDNMPLLWQTSNEFELIPTDKMRLKSSPFVGLRTGNRDYGFEELPVVVMGYRSPPCDMYDAKKLIAEASTKNAKGILEEAAKALTTYMCMTNPNATKLAKNLDVEIFADRMKVNPMAKNLIPTKEPTGLTFKGLVLGEILASEHYGNNGFEDMVGIKSIFQYDIDELRFQIHDARDIEKRVEAAYNIAKSISGTKWKGFV